MLDVKELINKLLSAVKVDYIVEEGTNNGWTYRKWNSGMLDAERTRNVGQYTVNTVEASPIRVGGTLSSSLPSMAISGEVEVTLMGNSSNSACFIEHISNTTWRIAKAVGTNVTLNNLTVCERTVGARWK